MENSRIATRSLIASSDLWVGLVLALLGAAAAWIASGFDDSSRGYPLGLSLFLLALGVVVIINAVRGSGAQASFGLAIQVVIPAATIIVLWIVGLTSGFGYLASTFLMQMAFLTICGVRKMGHVLTFAALISGVSYLVFFVLLGVRLPTPLAPWLL